MTDDLTYELLRIRTRDGEETTVYLVRLPLATTRGVTIRLVSTPRASQPVRAGAGR
jgi:hypothetical protein